MNKPKIIVSIPVSFVLLIISFTVNAQSMAPGWTCNSFTWQGDIWMRSYWQGAGQFDIKIGAGGAISMLRDAQNGYEQLLSPSFIGETTDRIVQWVTWDELLRVGPNHDDRFNINQGGNKYGGTTDPSAHLAQIIDVDMDETNCIVSVYAIHPNQWQPQLDNNFQATFSSFTQYQLVGAGEIKIRRMVMVGDVTLNGSTESFNNVRFQAWTPLKAPKFNGVALSVTQSGQPNWWYQYNFNIPETQQLPVDQTHGYAIAFKVGAWQQEPAVGIVYGKKQPCIFTNNQCSTTTGNYVLRLRGWDNVIALLPDILNLVFTNGTTIDQELYLVPRRVLSQSGAIRLQQRASSVERPHIIYPGSSVSQDTQDILDNLSNNLNSTGIETEHLAPLL